MNSSAPQANRPLPLAGVKVLDVSQVMAGPYCCMLLADMGADVIKVEPPGSGDQTRGAMGFKMKGPDSMGFLNMNRNKRSIAINLKSDAGKEILFELAKDADILVENYRPGVMKRLGVGYEVMSKINPALVYVSISGFGQSGPWAERPHRFLSPLRTLSFQLQRFFREQQHFRRCRRWPFFVAQPQTSYTDHRQPKNFAQNAQSLAAHYPKSSLYEK